VSVEFIGPAAPRAPVSCRKAGAAPVAFLGARGLGLADPGRRTHEAQTLELAASLSFR